MEHPVTAWSPETLYLVGPLEDMAFQFVSAEPVRKREITEWHSGGRAFDPRQLHQ
jgi:hypothetical protein